MVGQFGAAQRFCLQFGPVYCGVWMCSVFRCVCWASTMDVPLVPQFEDCFVNEDSAPEDLQLSQHDQTMQFIDFNPEAE